MSSFPTSCDNSHLTITSPDSGDKTFDAFKALALKASKPSIAPGKLPIGGLRKLSVDVGANGLTFTPNNITEIGRTVVEFTFNPKVCPFITSYESVLTFQRIIL